MLARVSFVSKKLKSEVSMVLRRLRSVDDLIGAGFIAQEDRPSYETLSTSYDIGITDHVAKIIGTAQDPQNSPVGRQYIPSLAELKITPEEMRDPIGDDVRSPVKGIVHRYPDRVLLKAASVCGVYCRYCFRREMIGAGAEHLNDDDLEEALSYIRANKQIWEVILTGGDPLVLSARKLEHIINALGDIEHVQVIRIHTRIPVANPMQITDTILSVFKSSKKPIYLVLHVNHADELNEKSIDLFGSLREAGCTLMAQSVLLAGVNDDPRVLETLFKKLISLHVQPYYLHHPDLAKGTSHFRVSLARGQEIFRQLRGRVSGICLPTYVLDIPGGYGKIPVEHVFCTHDERDGYVVEDFMGQKHAYKDAL